MGVTGSLPFGGGDRRAERPHQTSPRPISPSVAAGGGHERRSPTLRDADLARAPPPPPTQIPPPPPSPSGGTSGARASRTTRNRCSAAGAAATVEVDAPAVFASMSAIEFAGRRADVRDRDLLLVVFEVDSSPPLPVCFSTGDERREEATPLPDSLARCCVAVPGVGEPGGVLRRPQARRARRVRGDGRHKGAGCCNSSAIHQPDESPALGPGGAGRAQCPSCAVDGCEADLSKCRDYHRRHKVCEAHSKTPVVVIAGRETRFFQQCSRGSGAY